MGKNSACGPWKEKRKFLIRDFGDRKTGLKQPQLNAVYLDNSKCKNQGIQSPPNHLHFSVTCAME